MVELNSTVKKKQSKVKTYTATMEFQNCEDKAGSIVEVAPITGNLSHFYYIVKDDRPVILIHESFLSDLKECREILV